MLTIRCHGRCTASGNVGEFTCLAVAGSFGGRGLGEALVRAAEAHARRSGCDRMLLGVMCTSMPSSNSAISKLFGAGCAVFACPSALENWLISGVLA